MASRWYYERAGAVAGPCTEAEMMDLITRGQLEISTPTWAEGSNDRKPVAQHPDLARYYPPWAVREAHAKLPPVESTLSAKSYSWSPQARKLGGLWGGLRIALFIYMAGETALALGAIAGLVFFQAIESGGLSDQGEVASIGSSIDMFGMCAAVLFYAGFIPSVILYCRFVHRAMKNLHLSNAWGVTISPAWAAGWNFVPIMLLWKPFQAMQEIWKSSRDPARANYPAPATLGWWWACWIIGNLLGQVSFRLTLMANDSMDPIGALRTSYYVDIIGWVMAIACSLLLLRITRDIKEQQDDAGAVASTFD